MKDEFDIVTHKEKQVSTGWLIRPTCATVAKAPSTDPPIAWRPALLWAGGLLLPARTDGSVIPERRCEGAGSSGGGAVRAKGCCWAAPAVGSCCGAPAACGCCRRRPVLPSLTAAGSPSPQ